MATKVNEFVIAAAGTQVTTSGSSAATAIPNNASAVIAKYVRLTATTQCYVKPGFVGTTCTVNDALVQSGESLILNVHGFTHIAHLQETAACKLTITPLEVG